MYTTLILYYFFSCLFRELIFLNISERMMIELRTILFIVVKIICILAHQFSMKKIVTDYE